MTASMTRSGGRRRLAAILVCCVLLAAPALAQTDPTPDVDPGDASPHTSVITTVDWGMTESAMPIAEGESVELSLEELISLALERNLGLAVQRYERNRSLLVVLQNLGIYDLNLSSTLFTDSNTQPVTSALTQATGPETTTTDRATLNLSQLTAFGGTAELGFVGNKRETNDRNALFNPSFFSSVDLTFTQPLLRNFGRLATERNLIIARVNGRISLETFEQRGIL